MHLQNLEKAYEEFIGGQRYNGSLDEITISRCSKWGEGACMSFT
jgi:hypothetical protein